MSSASNGRKNRPRSTGNIFQIGKPPHRDPQRRESTESTRKAQRAVADCRMVGLRHVNASACPLNTPIRPENKHKNEGFAPKIKKLYSSLQTINSLCSFALFLKPNRRLLRAVWVFASSLPIPNLPELGVHLWKCSCSGSCSSCSTS